MTSASADVACVTMKDDTWNANALRIRRVIAGLSQAALGDAIGVADTTISKWEASIHGPPEDVVRKLAKALGCKSEDFYREVEVR